MVVQKYKKYYSLMVGQNQELFDQFLQAHQGYQHDQVAWADRFHRIGREIKDVMRDWERRLCSGTERGQYAQYSSKLAEKFWLEIKRDFPLIDEVGLIKN